MRKGKNTCNHSDSERWYDKIDDYRWLFWVIFCLAVLFIIIAFFVFKWGHPFMFRNDSYVVDSTLFGTYGDFIGGVLGTIFTIISVFFLLVTFRHQRIVTKDNHKQMETQRFNDLFFELLHLYQSEVDELCGSSQIIDSMEKKDDGKIRVQGKDWNYNNKDYFDFEKEKIQKKYRNRKSYIENIKQSVNYYMLFYIENRSKIGAYFRTLYRIYELIDCSSEISEKQKKEYSKIVRAQLTESELFFIRYNAMTIYGKSFVKYINKYNILKHLPAFELLEFKDWWGKDSNSPGLNIVEREGINIIYSLIRKKLQEVLKKSSSNNYVVELMPDDEAKYQISMTLIQQYDFSVTITIKTDSTKMTNEFLGFNKMEEKRIQQLMDCFLKELFMYSNFCKLNNLEDGDFYSQPIFSQNNVTTIICGVKSKSNELLKIKYSNN